MSLRSEPRSIFDGMTFSGSIETSEYSAQCAATSNDVAKMMWRRGERVMKVLRFYGALVNGVSDEAVLSHARPRRRFPDDNPQLADLIGQRLPGDFEKRSSLILVSRHRGE